MAEEVLSGALVVNFGDSIVVLVVGVSVADSELVVGVSE